MLCSHCRNIELDGSAAADNVAERASVGNGSLGMGMRCERCAAGLGPDLTTDLRRKMGQLQQFGLADADEFILEPVIGPAWLDRSGSDPTERRERRSPRER